MKKGTYNISVGRGELDFLHQACIDNGMYALAEKLYKVPLSSPQTMYSYKEMENAVMLSAKLYDRIYDCPDFDGGFGDACSVLIGHARELEKIVESNDDDDYLDTLYDYVEEIEKDYPLPKSST